MERGQTDQNKTTQMYCAVQLVHKEKLFDSVSSLTWLISKCKIQFCKRRNIKQIKAGWFIITL